ncbi:hypothetical protein [Paenibacillus sp. Root52]|uniref:hypothetical protein n=1 Tax=Paenibacillus sp. Root52 TaxID=1736552 RepID=UPI000A741DDF|nr:hypothetical protein [Paenibacillus sp. Root52]
MDYTEQLERLYNLTQTEAERPLTPEESAQYTELYDNLTAADVPIEFAINI